MAAPLRVASIRVAAKAAVLMAMRVTGSGAAVLTQILIARRFGPDDLAQFLLLIAAANLLAAILPLGYQAIAPYFVAQYRAEDNPHRLLTFVRHAYASVLVTGALCFAIAIVAGFVFADLSVGLPAGLSPGALVVVATVAPAFALTSINANVNFGMLRPYAALVPDSLVKPLVMLTVLFAMAIGWLGANIPSVPLVAAVALSAIALVQAFGFLRRYAGSNTDTDTDRDTGALNAEPGRWRRFAFPWLVIVLVTELFLDFDLLLLSGLMQAEDLARFGVCVRIYVLLGFMLTAVYSLVLPEAFAAGTQKDEPAFVHRLRQANLVATGLAAFSFVGSAIVGPWFLALFGPGFAEATPALLILVAGLTVRAAFGPASVILSLHDRPYASFPGLLAGLATLIAANLLLVPLWGLEGAATSVLAALAVWSVGLWALTWLKTGRNISMFARA